MAVLLAFDHASVAGEQAVFAEFRLEVGRNSLRARARPSMTAPDWLSLPLPLTLTKTSIRPAISVTWSGSRISFCWTIKGK